MNIKGDYESFRFGHKLKRLESRKWRLINGGKNESIVASSLEDLIENKTRLIYSGDEIKLFQNGVEVGVALGAQQQSNEICIENTSDGDAFEFRNGGQDNVSLTWFFILLHFGISWAVDSCRSGRM